MSVHRCQSRIRPFLVASVRTDLLRSYGADLREISATVPQETGRSLNSREENSHLPFRRRELTLQRFRRMRRL